MRMPRIIADLTPRWMCLLMAAASADLLLIALAFEHIGGLLPCSLCIAQRMPHIVIILLGVLGFALNQPRQHLLIGGGLALAIAGIALYHMGVEWQWWAGPSGCSAELAGDDLSSLTDALLALPVVKCDEIAWSFAGLSMAGWHFVACLALAAFAFYGARKASHAQG